MMSKEIWKPVPGYVGLYEVSNFGNIKSLNYRRSGKSKILSPRMRLDGYLHVELCKNGKRQNIKIHRIVCAAFHDNPFYLPQVDHINGVKTDNRADNLRWCDNGQNVRYAREKKKYSRTANKRSIICIESGIVYESGYEAARKLAPDRDVKRMASIIHSVIRDNTSWQKLHFEYCDK